MLPDLTVGVRNDVLRVGVDAEEAGDLGDDASLLEAFAYRALGRGLADVLGSAGQGPLAGVAAALEKDGTAVVDDKQVARGDEGVRLRRGRVVVELSPAHVCRCAPVGSCGPWRAAWVSAKGRV